MSSTTPPSSKDNTAPSQPGETQKNISNPPSQQRPCPVTPTPGTVPVHVTVAPSILASTLVNVPPTITALALSSPTSPATATNVIITTTSPLCLTPTTTVIQAPSPVAGVPKQTSTSDVASGTTTAYVTTASNSTTVPSSISSTASPAVTSALPYSLYPSVPVTAHSTTTTAALPQVPVAAPTITPRTSIAVQPVQVQTTALPATTTGTPAVTAVSSAAPITSTTTVPAPSLSTQAHPSRPPVPPPRVPKPRPSPSPSLTSLSKPTAAVIPSKITLVEPAPTPPPDPVMKPTQIPPATKTLSSAASSLTTSISTVGETRGPRRPNLHGFQDGNWYKIRNVGDNSVVQLDDGNKIICAEEKDEKLEYQLFKAVHQGNGTYRVMVKAQSSQERLYVWDYLAHRKVLLQRKAAPSDKQQQNWKSEPVPCLNSIYLIVSPVPDAEFCLKNTGIGQQIQIIPKEESVQKDNSTHWYLELQE